jgi:N-acetylmuramoyl-L-alanine amidase
LADAEAAGATFLVTDDVDDFAPTDLGEASVSAVNPDLFLSVHTDSAVYQTAIEHMVKNMRNPARTAKELHGAISRQHPRLFAAHQDLFSVPSQSTGQRQPAVVFRGNTCLRCLSSFAAGIDSTGICDVCRATYPANVRR